MAKILLTDSKTGSAISIDESLLLKAYTLNGLTKVEYLSEEDGRRVSRDVTEVLANIGGQSSLLISVTEENSGATIWINKDRIVDIAELDSKAVLKFDVNGALPERVKLTDTAAAVKEATYVKDGDNIYAIDSFTTGPDTIVLDAGEGDVTAGFTSGVIFTVFGEGDSNDSIYSVVSSAYGSETVITVNETPTAGASNGGKVRLKA